MNDAEVQPITGAGERRASDPLVLGVLRASSITWPTSRRRLQWRQSTPNRSRAASTMEARPRPLRKYPAGGSSCSAPVDPQASNDGVPVVPVLGRSGSTLLRTMSAVQMARPAIVAQNSVPMLSCHCPKAEDLPDGCEKCLTGFCAFLAYLFYGAIVVFASWTTTKLALAAGWYDPHGWMTALLTLGCVLFLGCLCAGLAAATESMMGVTMPPACCLDSPPSLFVVLSLLRCFGPTRGELVHVERRATCALRRPRACSRRALNLYRQGRRSRFLVLLRKNGRLSGPLAAEVLVGCLMHRLMSRCMSQYAR